MTDVYRLGIETTFLLPMPSLHDGKVVGLKKAWLWTSRNNCWIEHTFIIQDLAVGLELGLLLRVSTFPDPRTSTPKIPNLKLLVSHEAARHVGLSMYGYSRLPKDGVQQYLLISQTQRSWIWSIFWTNHFIPWLIIENSMIMRWKRREIVAVQIGLPWSTAGRIGRGHGTSSPGTWMVGDFSAES